MGTGSFSFGFSFAAAAFFLCVRSSLAVFSCAATCVSGVSLWYFLLGLSHLDSSLITPPSFPTPPPPAPLRI